METTYCSNAAETKKWAESYSGPALYIRYRKGATTALATVDHSGDRETTKHDVAYFNHRADAEFALKIIAND